MNLEEEFFNARVSNWIEVIKAKFERIVKEHIHDEDFSINLLSGEYALMAQDEFSDEAKKGLYDGQCVRIELN